MNLNKIGIVFIENPAQLLPIAGEPVFSTRLLRFEKKDFREDSIRGSIKFQPPFRMPKLECILGFNSWKTTEAKKS